MGNNTRKGKKSRLVQDYYGEKKGKKRDADVDEVEEVEEERVRGKDG